MCTDTGCACYSLKLPFASAITLAFLSVLWHTVIDRIETYDVAAGETLTVNLKGGGYAVVGVTISVDNESETYTEKEGIAYLSTKESIIKGSIIEIIGNYTKDELGESKDGVKAELLKTLKKTFGADYVVGVDFTKFTMD